MIDNDKATGAHTGRGLFPRLTSLAGRFLGDRRGATAVQALFLLPVMIGALGLGALLWETLMIRRSLHTGTYLAMRYLSLYPPDDLSDVRWSDVAREFVYAELKNNPWVDKQHMLAGGSPIVPVQVTLIDGGYKCRDKFEVYAGYQMFAVPGQLGDLGVLPGLDRIMLEDRRVGEVLCD